MAAALLRSPAVSSAPTPREKYTLAHSACLNKCLPVLEALIAGALWDRTEYDDDFVWDDAAHMGFYAEGGRVLTQVRAAAVA